MTIRLPILIVLVTFATSSRSASLDLTSLPDLQSGRYKAVPYIRAAAALQNMGRESACQTLLRAAQTNQANRAIFVLCRMLFTKRATADFRCPGLGVAHFLGGTDYADWPLEPVELVDGIPFQIVWGYSLGGRGESAEGYLRYCMTTCDWSTVRFSEVTTALPNLTLTKLYTSPKWRRALESHEREFLSAQIE